MRFWLMCVWLVGVWSGFAQETAHPYTVTIKLADENQRPIPNAWVSVFEKVGNMKAPLFGTKWQKTDAEGTTTFRLPLSRVEWMIKEMRTAQKRSRRWEVVISAPGYLPHKQAIEDASFGTTYTFTLKRGKPFELILRNETGRPLPESLIPAVFAFEPDDTGIRVVFDYLDSGVSGQGSEQEPLGVLVTTQIHGQFGAERLSEGRYRISLPEGYDKPLFVLVHHKGFLRGFSAVIPAEQVRAGSAELTLPKPFHAKARLDATQAKGAQLRLIYQLSVSIPYGDTRFGYTIDADWLPNGQAQTLEWDDLYGDLSITLQSFAFEGENFWSGARLSPDKEVVIAYTPADPERFKGSLTHSIQVYRADHTPASGLTYRLKVYDSGRLLTLAEGVLDAEGRAVLNQLRADGSYYLEVDGAEVGFFALDSPQYRRTTFRIPPRAGDPAPDLTLTDLRTQQKFRLAELKGKWVYIDFWATWCGPCGNTIRRLAEEGDEITRRFGDRLVLLTISLDDTPEPIRPYLEKANAWDKARHCWSGAGGWYSPAGIAFVVNSIPQEVLIDPSGKIAWRGRPTYSSLLAEIMNWMNPEPAK